MCKYCNIPIYIRVNGEYIELPNNYCPMCGEKVEFGLKEGNNGDRAIRCRRA